MNTGIPHLRPLLLCALMTIGLCNCQLASSALRAPATLLKGMGGAVSRTVGIGSNDVPVEKPAIDAETLRHYRDSVEQLPEVPTHEDLSNLAHADTDTDPVL